MLLPWVSTFQSPYPAFRVNKIMKEYVHIQGQAFLVETRALHRNIEKPDFMDPLTNNVGLKIDSPANNSSSSLN
jgi:hypothetical protein